jgi:phospholipase C
LNSLGDLDDGMSAALLDGFVYQQAIAPDGGACVTSPDLPQCTTSRVGVNRHDVMGYHTAAEIPNYWAYARHFVLQGHMFESVRSWSLPSHMYLTSEWSAVCTNPRDPSTCSTSPAPPQPSPGIPPAVGEFVAVARSPQRHVALSFRGGTGAGLRE